VFEKRISALKKVEIKHV